MMIMMMILENDGDDVDHVYSLRSDGAEWSGVHLLQRQKAAGSGLGKIA